MLPILGTVEVLFPKIDDKQIAQEVEALHERAAKLQKVKPMTEVPTPNPTPSPAPAMTPPAAPAAEGAPKLNIQYEDFAKIDFRVGKVLAAEAVPKAEKLLKLQIDLGTEKRQILAGIAKSYTPEFLVGKSVVVVANLAPKKMMGVESQGMVLAGTGPEGIVIVSPEKEIPPGSGVK